MRRSFFLLVIVAIATMLAVVAPASAAVTEDFFSGGDASASWVAFDPPHPGATENAAVKLTVLATSGTDYDDFAGVELVGVGTSAPATPPSFYFRSDVTNAGSGGSPRLVMLFSNGGNMQLRPLSWTADTWVLIDGAGANWDNSGGTCGFLYATTYATALACHSGASVTAVFVVDDSGWFHPGGYNHYVDAITYGDDVLSYPTNCNDDFTGSHENGPVSSVVHEVEPLTLDLAGTVHDVNCDVIVANGL